MTSALFHEILDNKFFADNLKEQKEKVLEILDKTSLSLEQKK